jgi:Flp pilus assembly protein TadG
VSTRRHQRGTTTVEFAIVGALLMVAMLGVIEFGRLLFTVNVLNEAARRSARLASVCPIGSQAIPDAALFATLPGLTASNVQVQYLNDAGNVIAAPANGASFGTIRYVRVRIANYAHQMAIPFVGRTLTLPAFLSTLPRESLGVSQEGLTPC